MTNHTDGRFDPSGESFGHNYPESAWQPLELKSGSAIFFNGYYVCNQNHSYTYVVNVYIDIYCTDHSLISLKDSDVHLLIIICRQNHCSHGPMMGTTHSPPDTI